MVLIILLQLCVIICYNIFVTFANSHISKAKFEIRIQRAIETSKEVLYNNKHLSLASETVHEYQDKYGLAEFMSQSMLHLTVNALTLMGLNLHDYKVRDQISTWLKQDTIKLQFNAIHTCVFGGTIIKEIESDAAVIEFTGGFFNNKLAAKIVRKVNETTWNMDKMYEIRMYPSRNESDYIIINAAAGYTYQTTSTEMPPYREKYILPPITTDITDLVRYALQLTPLDESSPLQSAPNPWFTIDRTHSACYTPRRNNDIQQLITTIESYRTWNQEVEEHVNNHRSMNSNKLLDDVFIPIYPLLYVIPENTSMVDDRNHVQNTKGGIYSSDLNSTVDRAVLPVKDLIQLVAHSNHTLHKSISMQLDQILCNDKVECRKKNIDFTKDIMKMIMIAAHVVNIVDVYMHGIQSIEDMVHQQLVRAIGKEITPMDVTEYMNMYHMNEVLFNKQYQAPAFHYLIRRSTQHTPEGSISMEMKGRDGGIVNIPTITRQDMVNMSFVIHASTRVQFSGMRYVHGWLHHTFVPQASTANNQHQSIGLSLVASARQFSSFILLVGRIVSNNEFQPTHGILIKDKDVVKIPLYFEMVANQKVFKRAIKTLSRTQQAFVTAIRQMQLQHTLFGIVTIQIKPQLERILNLSEDALLKEISLTQDIMDLFITYQIPSDLISVDDATRRQLPNMTDVDIVKLQVKKIKDMIQVRKQEELDERKKQKQENVEIPTVIPTGARAFPSNDPDNQEPSYGPSLWLHPEGEILTGSPSGAWAFPSNDPDHQEPLSGPSSLRSDGPSEVHTADPIDIPVEKSSGLFPNDVVADNHGESGFTLSGDNDGETGGTLSGDNHGESGGTLSVNPVMYGHLDISALPSLLDDALANPVYERLYDNEYHHDRSVTQANIIHVESAWSRNRMKSLVMEHTNTETIHSDEVAVEYHKVLELLDSLTKSGALSLDSTGLVTCHVLVSITQHFDTTLINSIIQDNVNPIHALENTLMIMASTIHNTTKPELMRS